MKKNTCWKRISYAAPPIGAEAAPERRSASLREAHEQLTPFIKLGALLRSGGADGVLEKDGCRLPFRSRFPKGLCCGGYLHSEVSTLAVGTADWSGLGASLEHLGVVWLLAEAPQSDEAFQLLRAELGQAGWRLCLMPGRHSPYIDFEHGEGCDFYSFLRAANAKEYRNLRAARRKLEQAGQVDIRFTEGELSFELADELARVEERSSKSGKGIFSRAHLDRTMALLAGVPARVALLYLDGKLLAWDLDFQCENVVYSYNRAYDGSFSNLAPGKILHYANLARAYDNGVSRAELLGDSDPLKMRLATGVRQRSRLAAFRPDWIGKLAYRLFILRQNLKRARFECAPHQERLVG